MYRVHPNTPIANITELVTSEGYEIRKIECISNPEAKYKSFRLTIPNNQYARAYCDDFPWPEGVRVKRFISPSRNREADARSRYSLTDG